MFAVDEVLKECLVAGTVSWSIFKDAMQRYPALAVGLFPAPGTRGERPWIGCVPPTQLTLLHAPNWRTSHLTLLCIPSQVIHHLTLLCST